MTIRSPKYIALMFVIGLVLLLLNLPHQISGQMKLAVGGLFLPLFGLAGSASSLKDQVIHTTVPRAELKHELDDLRVELARRDVESLAIEALRLENDRLRDALEWRKRQPWKLKLARVIARDPANWWRTVHIDLGKQDGLRTNLTVLTPAGLVGKVSLTGKGRSQVLMIGDPGCRVSCRVRETRDLGILGPISSSVLNSQLLELTCLLGGSRMEPGNHVDTSGQGGVFPAGIPVGTVLQMRTGQNGLLHARVKIMVNLNRLEEVWVIMP